MSNGWDSFPLVDHPLDQYLGGVLAGHGAAFEAAGQQYGVDPTLLAAIATLESGHGKSRAAVAYNNPTGMMDPRNPKKFIKYDSIPEGINATASNLARNYLKQGLSTIPEIGAKYSPPGASNDPNQTNAQWPSQVQKLYSSMGGTQTRFGPQPVGPAVTMMGGYNEPKPLAYNAPAAPAAPAANNVTQSQSSAYKPQPLASNLPPIHPLASDQPPQNLIDLFAWASYPTQSY